MGAVGLPKGVFTRGERDFLLRGMGCGHVDNISHAANATVSLFNNATDGTVLGVVGWTVTKDGTGGTVQFRHFNGTLGAFVSNGSPLRIGDPTPFGQFFNAIDPNPIATNPRNFLGVAPNVTGAQWFNANPFALIRPGWSLVVGTDSTAAICLNFWWTQRKG